MNIARLAAGFIGSRIVTIPTLDMSPTFSRTDSTAFVAGRIGLNEAGDTENTFTTGTFAPEDWIQSPFDPSDYECRLTINSGDSPNTGTSDSVGVWLSLNVALPKVRREWTWEASAGTPSLSGNATLEIRDSLTQALYASDTFDFTVTKT